MNVKTAALAALLMTGPAAAEEASIDYALSIAGLEIGDIGLNLAQIGDRYALDLDGGFQFLFFGGRAEGRVEGARVDGRFEPADYRLYFEGPTRDVETRISFADGAPQDWRVTPEPTAEMMEGRTPLPADALAGAVDMISAFLISAQTAGEACSQALKVFSGFVRFDVTLSPGAPPADGVAACKVGYEPIAGHKLDENGEPRVIAGEDLSISLFELTPNVWAPHRVGFRTPVGTLAFERRAGAQTD